MQKVVVASAILATAALAVDPLYCAVTKAKTADADKCPASVTAVEDFVPTTTYTGTTPAPLFIKITGTQLTGCEAAKADETIGECVTALGAAAPEKDDQTCFDKAKQGASPTCAIASGAACVSADDDVCVTGYECTGTAGEQTCTKKADPTDFYCSVEVVATGVDACEAEGVNVIDWDPKASLKEPKKYVKVNAVAAATEPCKAAVAGTDALATCLKALGSDDATKVVDISGDEKTCVVDGPTGVNASCPLAEGDVCVDGQSCETGTSCKTAPAGSEGKTCQKDEAVTPFQCEVNADVSAATYTWPAECTADVQDLVKKYTSKATFDPEKIFAEISATGAETNPCQAAIGEKSTDLGKCLDKLAAKDLTADVAACAKEGQGRNAQCPLADGVSCDSPTLNTCGANSTCDATTKKCTAKSPPATGFAAVLTGVKQDNKDDLKKALDEIFTEAAPTAMAVLADPVNACAGTTVKSIDAFYSERAYVTFSAEPTADCKTQATEKLGVTIAAKDAGDKCVTVCGADQCKCESGQECHPAEADKQAQADCASGLICDETKAPPTCVSSGVYASAALAVAAAVLAVIF